MIIWVKFVDQGNENVSINGDFNEFQRDELVHLVPPVFFYQTSGSLVPSGKPSY